MEEKKKETQEIGNLLDGFDAICHAVSQISGPFSVVHQTPNVWPFAENRSTLM